MPPHSPYYRKQRVRHSFVTSDTQSHNYIVPTRAYSDIRFRHCPWLLIYVFIQFLFCLTSVRNGCPLFTTSMFFVCLLFLLYPAGHFSLITDSVMQPHRVAFGPMPAYASRILFGLDFVKYQCACMLFLRTLLSLGIRLTFCIILLARIPIGLNCFTAMLDFPHV